MYEPRGAVGTCIMDGETMTAVAAASLFRGGQQTNTHTRVVLFRVELNFPYKQITAEESYGEEVGCSAAFTTRCYSWMYYIICFSLNFLSAYG